jgi:hypothetical protein
LRLCVSREIWTLIAEQIAYCATRADFLEAAARRANEASEATREAESEDIREDANLAANLVFADDAGTDGVFQTPARCLVAATDILAKHLCALVRSVLANLNALDLELKTRTSFTRDGVSETERAKEASFAARARETLRLALPPALDGLGRTPRLCEGLEGLVGADGAKKNAARDAGAWWHGGRTTFAECTPERRSESESRVERFPVKRFSASDQRRASEPPFASKARSRLVSFGPDGNRSAETRDEGSERFARAAAAAVRLARARLGGPGSTTRVFELECVKETFALFELESDAARA